jgi:hypothetical protein
MTLGDKFAWRGPINTEEDVHYQPTSTESDILAGF